MHGAGMSRSAKVTAALLALLLAGSAAFLLLRPKGEGQVARVTLNGKVVEEIDLSRVEQPYTLTLEGPGGFSNTITVEQGRICVSKAGLSRPDLRAIRGISPTGRPPLCACPTG